MPADLVQDAIARYAAIERRIGDWIFPRLTRVACAACQPHCCRADICRRALQSWWLREVGVSVHGRWWPTDWRTREAPIAQTDTGCLLRAGRPILCWTFHCEQYFVPCESWWEVIGYAFLCDLPSYTVHVSSTVDLIALDEEDVIHFISPIRARVAAAEELLDLADRLLAPDTPKPQRHRIALKLIAVWPSFLLPIPRRAVLRTLDATDLSV